MLDAPKQQADRGGKGGLAKLGRQAKDAVGVADPHRLADDAGGQFGQAGHLGAAAGQHHAADRPVVHSGLAHPADRHLENFRHPGVQRFGQGAAGDGIAPLALEGGQLHGFVGHRFRVHAAPLDLDFLGHVQGGPQGGGQVAGEGVAADGQHGGVPGGALAVDHHIGSAGADVQQHHAHLPLIAGERRFRRRHALQHHAADRQVFGFDGLDGVLQHDGLADHYMGFDFHQPPGQAHRIADAGKAVHGVAHGDYVQHLLAVVDLGERPFQQPVQHLGRNVVRGGLVVQDFAAVDAGDVGAADADVGAAGHGVADVALGFGQGRLHRGPGFLDVFHPPLLDALGRNHAGAENFQVAFGADPRKQDGHF